MSELTEKVRRKLGRRAFRNPAGDQASVEGAEMMVDAGGKLAKARKKKAAKGGSRGGSKGKVRRIRKKDDKK